MVREMKVGRQKCKASLLCSCLIVLMFLVSTLPASATPVAETNNFPGNSGVGYAPDSDFFGALSFSFTTDANDYTFNFVELVLGTGMWDSGESTLTVALQEDDGATPGTLLEILSGDGHPTESDTVYQYSGTSLLAANTTYWITLINEDLTGGDYYDFLVADTGNESAGSVWSIGDDLYSSISGFQNLDGPFASRFDATIVNQTPVPVPGSALLLMLGLIGLVGLRLNKQLF